MTMILFAYLLLTLIQDPLTYIPEDQTFSVWQPGNFEEIYEEIETDIGILEVFTIVCNPEDTGEEKNFLYLLNYTTYPEDLILHDSIDTQLEMIDLSIEDIVTSYDGEMVYSAPLDDVTGKLFRMSYDKGGYIVKGKVFYLENRLYIMQVHCLKDKSLNTQMDQFLDSFKSKKTERTKK